MNKSPIEVAMMTVELAQLRKASLTMAQHILATPARGEEALSEVRRIANDIVAANTAADNPSQVPL